MTLAVPKYFLLVSVHEGCKFFEKMLNFYSNFHTLQTVSILSSLFFNYLGLRLNITLNNILLLDVYV